ncbi:MAG: hypothetical protein JWR19_3807 [Pedosphaera sp.]|nr:hypothetical protein [Pedosphaera sp.]
MGDLYDLFELVMVWVLVVVCIGLCCYLAYRQYRSVKLRRWYRRHKARHRDASEQSRHSRSDRV